MTAASGPDDPAENESAPGSAAGSAAETTPDEASEEVSSEDLDAELAGLIDGVGNYSGDPFSIVENTVAASDEGSTGTYSSCEEALEDAVSSLERVTAERDEYLDLARRGQAEFENYRRRVEGQRVEQIQRAAESLVSELLPVLDACEAALAHGAADVAPVHSALVTILNKQGLAALAEVDVPFDPTVHEAVLTEAGDGDVVVIEVLRTGYTWNGRVLRPAMVKVRG